MSFDDSDRFEEDSLCSWGSEPESLCNNWRGWKRPQVPSTALSAPLLASNQRRSEGRHNHSHKESAASKAQVNTFDFNTT